jgi:endoglucanase
VCRYGIFVLFVEVMGATTTLLYGVNLLMTPVYDKIPIEEGSVPEVAKVDHHYHIRVLVPCYRESLELVQRTVTAALGAQLPTNCKRCAVL